MITPIFAAEAGGSRIYKIGRVGLDTGTQDTGGVYTGVLRTERINPLGEVALLLFRRAVIRIWRTGGYTISMKIFVDGQQTQVYDASGVLQPQSVTFTALPPSVVPVETIVEASINAQGTYAEVEITVDSDDIDGIFLPTELEIHFAPLRRARERTAQSS